MKLTPTMSNAQSFKGNLEGYAPEVKSGIEKIIKDTFEPVLLNETKYEKFGDKLKKMPLFEKAGNLKSKIPFMDSAQTAVKNANVKIQDGIADVIGKASTTKLSKKLVVGLSKLPKPAARMSDLASIAVTYFYVNNTRKSSKIAEERKMPLMINNVLITAVSSTMAFTIDAFSDVFLKGARNALAENKATDVIKKATEQFPDLAKKGDDKALGKLAEDVIGSSGFKKALGDFEGRLGKAKSLTVFSFVVRFLVTILMVPVTGKLVDMVEKKTIESKKAKAAEATQKTEKPAEKDD